MSRARELCLLALLGQSRRHLTSHQPSATWLEEAAIPSRVIDELMGHASGHALAVAAYLLREGRDSRVVDGAEGL